MRMCKDEAMRRKPGALVSLEVAILGHAASRTDPFHGFDLAKALADTTGSRALTSHGTLYKALARLSDMGLLESEWEDAEIALAGGRPRRRLYRITAEGARRAATERRTTAIPSSLRPVTGTA
jgi:DNA-binding PadR family transcriptional regulator